AGQATLHFSPVPANSQVPGTNTFTILVDRTVTFSFSSLQWSFNNPFANPGLSQTAKVGSTVTLDGTGSTNPSGNGTLTYAWSFASTPAGSTATITNASSAIASFHVDVAGQYVVTLTVSNGAGSDSANVTITTEASLPVADAGPNQTAGTNTPVLLDGSHSSDTDGDPLTYSWSIISKPIGSTATLNNPTTVTPGFIPDLAGAYIIELVVSDGTLNSNPATVTVSTFNTPPVANPGLGQVVTVGAIVQLDGSASTDVNGNPLTFKWSLISKPTNSTASLSDPTAVQPVFTADL